MIMNMVLKGKDEILTLRSEVECIMREEQTPLSENNKFVTI